MIRELSFYYYIAHSMETEIRKLQKVGDFGASHKSQICWRGEGASHHYRFIRHYFLSPTDGKYASSKHGRYVLFY